MSKHICGACGAASPKQATYCADCGARVGGTACQCGAEIDPGATYCSTCGGEVESKAAADVGRRARRRRDAGIRWVRGDQQVAARITAADLEGRLQKGLEVQHGTRALLFVGGRYVSTLGPGRHVIESLSKRIGLKLADAFKTDGNPTVFVVDDGELGLDFVVGDLHASDNHNVILHGQASLRLAEPEIFLANLFRDRSRFTEGDLAEFIEAEIQDSLRDSVAQHTAEDLHRSRVRTDLEMELLSRWKATLEKSGFVLNRFRLLRAEVPGLEEAQDIRGDAGDAMAVAAAAREARGAYVESEFADLRLEGESVARRERLGIEFEIDKLRRRSERLEQRYPLLQQLLEGDNLEHMVELESKEDWRKFRLEVDKENLIDEQEWNLLELDTKADLADAKANRDYLYQRLMLTASADVEELKATRKQQLTLLEMRGGTELLEEQLNQADKQFQSEIGRQRQAFDQKLDQRDRNFEQEHKERKAKVDTQLDRIQRMEEIDQLSQDREHARELQLKVAEAEARHKEIAMFAGLTPDQIAAMGATMNPEQAAEFAEVFRAMKVGDVAEVERKMSEKMLAEVKEAYQRGQQLDHEKFQISSDADARHRAKRESLDEQEKDRLQDVATAGLTADDKKRGPWNYCSVHEQKFVGQECPRCKQEREP